MYCVVGAKLATRIEYVMDVNMTAEGKTFIPFSLLLCPNIPSPTVFHGLSKASVYAFRTSFL